MADAQRDQNFVTTATAVSSTDSTTILQLKVDPTTNYLLTTSTDEAITPTALSEVKRDQNFTPTVYGVSNTDGTTLVPIRTDDEGRLLVSMF